MRIEPPVAAREKRLAALLAAVGRDAGDAQLAATVEDAQLLGSLALAGVSCSWDEVRASRQGAGPKEALALRRALAAVPPLAPFTVAALRAWHEALAGPVGFRRGESEREGAPVAPPERIADRLAILEQWLATPGIRDLTPAQAAGLAYARIVEVRPFDDGNGRVARLAASHLMVAGGMRPPVLVAGDGPYLVACLRAAFRLDTEPLVSLLAEASARALEVMIQSLEKGVA